jgi:hypothetical protein
MTEVTDGVRSPRNLGVASETEVDQDNGDSVASELPAERNAIRELVVVSARYGNAETAAA